MQQGCQSPDHAFEVQDGFGRSRSRGIPHAVTEFTPNDRVPANVIYNNVLRPRHR
jgi:hypothetical protein